MRFEKALEFTRWLIERGETCLLNAAPGSCAITVYDIGGSISPAAIREINAEAQQRGFTVEDSNPHYVVVT